MSKSKSKHHESLDDSYMQDENMSDDDNAAPDIQSELDEAGENEDPLLGALEDLEGRVVGAVDDMKLHPGVQTSNAPGAPSVHDELAQLLRGVLEVAAHTGPSVARTYYQGIGAEGIELSVEEVWGRLVSDLILPVILEEAQTNSVPAKRTACLEFFRHFHKESQKRGSWLDTTTSGPQMGPYGSGASGSHSHSMQANNPVVRAQQKRRFVKKQAREAEILRYWIQASIACTTAGVFTAEASEAVVASRSIIAASASLRPSLKHIAQRIKDADDRGASKLFGPVMKMVEGVLKKLFLSTEAEETIGSGDAIRASSIKFLEILTLVCSRKPQDPAQRRRGTTTSSNDFSLEDLPSGHPVITKESLESIAEYSFATLRGLTILGGQVKIDENLLSDMLLTGGGSGSPASQVVSILKPAALAYLEIESALPDGDAPLDITLDRNAIEYDFLLTQKQYSLTLNAMSALALNRPMFFRESALCLSRRAVQPPVFTESGALTKAGVLSVTAHLRASCLTLLRNALSVSAKASDYLHLALKECDMEIQADKALKMAQQANALKTAGRAARNRANMFYEWDSSEVAKSSSKRQRETDDALAKMRAAKKARGLGHGIQLPQNMADAVELVMANLTHLPAKKPAAASGSKTRKVPMTLDFIVDAIMTNGASLAQEEGRWYDRDGGNAWMFNAEGKQKFELSSKFLDSVGPSAPKKPTTADSKVKDPRALFHDQAGSAASDAVGRIVTNSMKCRSTFHAQFGNEIAARLAWTLKNTKPPPALASAHSMAAESVAGLNGNHISSARKKSLEDFVFGYPLVNACLALDATTKPETTQASTGQGPGRALCDHVLYEAFAQSDITDLETGSGDYQKYEHSVDVYAASVVCAGARTDDKPNDADRKRVAKHTSAELQTICQKLPHLPSFSLQLVSALCDVVEITKKEKEASRKASQQSQQTIAASETLREAKVAAEKRATTVLLLLRDLAFARTDPSTRRGAVECAIMIASGRLQASQPIEDKALKLVMNVLFPKSESLASCVVEAASSELKAAADLASSKYNEIEKANKQSNDKNEKAAQGDAPSNEIEREVMEQVKKPSTLVMALCLRRPELISTLFEVSCQDKADALHKAVRSNMSKMARAAAAKHGAAAIALKVAGMTTQKEASLVLAFLDNLAPPNDKNFPDQDMIDACHEIQTLKANDGKKDPRYIIPVVSAMKRKELVDKLPEFVPADDKIFLAALERMGDKVARQALLFRDEPEEDTPSLKGMTLCEQLVFLHHLDFAAAGLPQKRYLDAIRLCLDNDEIYTDRVVMSALDHISGVFLTGTQGLPLAYMRTIILVCSKHESLHSWITSVLLPRLVEGKIYTDRRQWEGWMRCAKMLENAGDGGVSSLQAIRKLPKEQFELYRTRYGEPGGG